MYYGVLFPPPASSTYLLLGEVSGEALWPCHLSVAGAASNDGQRAPRRVPGTRRRVSQATGASSEIGEWPPKLHVRGHMELRRRFDLHLNDEVKKFLWIATLMFDPRFKNLDFFKGCEDLE